MANPSPLGVLFKKLSNFKANFLHQLFCKPLWPAPFWALTFFRKFKVIVSPELRQIQFACSAAAPPANILPSAAPPTSYCLSSSTLVPGPVLILPPTATTSSQPPAISAYLVRNPEVKSSSFSFRENQSLSDPPPCFKKIPDSMPDDVKIILQKFPPILCTGDVKLAPNHGVEHHIHTSIQPPVFAKSCRLDPEKLQIAKAEFKRLESTGIVLTIAQFFQKLILSRVIIKSLSRPRTSHKLQS
jgi:hypothetical protein